MAQRWILSVVALVLLALLVAFIFLYPRESTLVSETLRLGEFGVELTLDESLIEETLREAREEEGLGTVVHVLSTRFMSGGTACPLGAFYTIDQNAIRDSATTWTEESLALWQAPQGAEPARVKQFTDFYLIFEPSEESCSDDESLESDEAAARRALGEALTTARYIQY
jgi:hypothetical protein